VTNELLKITPAFREQARKTAQRLRHEPIRASIRPSSVTGASTSRRAKSGCRMLRARLAIWERYIPVCRVDGLVGPRRTGYGQATGSPPPMWSTPPAGHRRRRLEASALHRGGCPRPGRTEHEGTTSPRD
jgi:hypothetical protein